MSEEHEYSLTSKWVKERVVTIEIPGRDVLESSPPIDFWSECPDNTYSPEDLFLASAVACYAVSIPGVARRFHADFKNFIVHGKGHLKQGEFGWEFDEISLIAKIVIEKEKDRKKMAKVAERAHRYCIIANSMKCPVHLEYDIVVE